MKRRLPDSSPLRGVPDTARIASGEREGQTHDPGVQRGRSGNSSVDCAFARLHLFVNRLRHGKEIYMPSTAGGAFHLSIPDPQQICKSRMSPSVSNISTQTKDPRTQAPRAGMPSASRYLSTVITKATRLRLPHHHGFGPTTSARAHTTSLPSQGFLRTRFTRDLTRGMLRTRRWDM